MMLVALAMLVTGWFLPTFKLERFILGSDEYSIWQTVTGLWQDKSYILSVIIFFFSMVFPATKLGLMGWLWFSHTQEDERDRVLHWLGILGKWSMLDVFVVAILIVLVKASSLMDASAMYGIYIFAAAIALSMIVTSLIERLAKKG